MTDNGFDEYDLYEAQYADQFDVLDDLEGVTTQVVSPQKIAPLTSKDDDLPDISQKENRRRNLFPLSKDEPEIDLFTDDLYECNNLVIDEDRTESFSPEKKRPKLLDSSNHQNLPTTLDSDRDVVQERLENLRHKNNLTTPQILQKIKSYRKTRNAKDFLNEAGSFSTETKQSSIRLTKVLIRPPMNSKFIAATSSDGQRVYMRIKRDHKKKVPSINELITGSKTRSLLPQSMTELRQAIFDEKQFSIVEESRRITEEIRRDVLNLSSVTAAEASPDKAIDDDDNDRDEGIYSEDDNQKNLWVNKYAPTRYTHLLSDESVNRSLLKWLKLWDQVVFGREPIARKSRNQQDKPPNRKFANKKKPVADASSIDNDLDETKRPRLKAALLCGPPGLGKTTLAHVIAKHAGYHVVEMNASDDRSADVFQRKLDETTQMKSVLGVDPRPNCLIIDEIDGAPQAAINILLGTMNRNKKTDSKRKRNKTGANTMLLRPIICICNDLYVPALRQLRQQSLVLQFPPTTSAKLASRLRQMCRVQRLDCDMTCLLALCEKSSNDIRTCINTLQFLQSKGKNKINLESIQTLPIGQKDQHQSVFYVWNEIFQQPKNKRHMQRHLLALQQSLDESRKVSQFSSRFYHILNIVLANGEYEKTLQGVFDNFLLMKFKDCAMQAVNKAYEWLVTYDMLNVDVVSRQEWSLMRYVPYLFVMFHFLFSCLSPPRIQFPQTAQENRQKLQKTENLLSSMFAEMSPTIRCFTSQTVALLDVIPHLLAIMTPNIRPVNMQLYTVAERKQLQDLVSSMLSYNLTFRQERNEDGQYTYALEPNMAAVCHFNDDTSSARRQLSYAVKQIIAKEVEMERMRRMEHVMIEKVSSQEPTDQSESKKKTFVPNHLRRLENTMNVIKVPAEKPVVDFFCRFTKIKRVDENGSGNVSKKTRDVRDPGIGNSELWFKYNEGFSNAVRRKVYVKDFL